MNKEQECLITDNMSIVGRVVAREMALGVPAWVDKADLEDVANLALVKAALDWKGPEDGRRCLKGQDNRSGDGTFAGFAYVSVHNAVINEIKALRFRNSGRVEMPPIEALGEFRQSMRGQEMALYRGLSALTPREYRVIMLTYWASRSQEEIGEDMGISQQAVAKILKSAKKSLAEVVNSDSQLPIQMQGEREQKGVGH